jgi:hypothetical protein
MPFTLSHTAIVLPFARLLARGRLLAATVIGAMVPDFGLLFPWHVQRFETHSAMALLTFCLPVGLASYWIFERIIKTPVLELLPEGAYARSRPFAAPADLADLSQWLLAACGVLVGATTHLVWDAFTHEGARGARLIPVLDEPIVEFGSHHMMGARLLQDGTSLIGLGVVFVFLCYALRRGNVVAVQSRALRTVERRAWVLAYAAIAIVLTALCYAGARVGEPGVHSAAVVVNGIAVAVVRALAGALLSVSLVLGFRLRA